MNKPSKNCVFGSKRVKETSKFSEVEATEALEWIKNCIGGCCINTCGTIDNFHNVLKDGVLLCKLVNAFQPSSVRRIQAPVSKCAMMENVSAFVPIARSMGVTEEESFVSGDLVERRDLFAVYMCILSLGRHAHRYGKPNFGKKLFTYIIPQLLED